MTKTIIFVLTNKCNLRCIYCYEDHNVETGISASKIEQICENELLTNDAVDELIFHFFGGEPFLRFDIIKEVVSFLQSKAWPKKWRCFASTNGTLVHGEVQEWLDSNKSFFTCGLSLDGTPAIHNHNRSNSYDSIDLDFFKRTWPGQSIKMTISEYTIDSLADGVIHLHNLGFKVACNLAYGIDWEMPYSEDALNRELLKLVEYYLLNPDVEPCTLLNMKVDYISSYINKETVHKWCGVGTHMAVYTDDENHYPCETFIPMSLGRTLDENITFKNEYPIECLDAKCQPCIYKHICPTCYGSNYKQFGDIFKKDDGYCGLMRCVFRANAYLRFKQVLSERASCSDSDKLRTLESIRLINEFESNQRV